MRRICGCEETGDHHINCAAMTVALSDHLKRCGWKEQLGVCADRDNHIKQGEAIINGQLPE